MTPEGLAFLKSWEGCRLEAYRDIGGVWTIGYGHIRGVAEGMTINQDAAEMLLLSDVAVAETAIELLVKVELSPCQRDALTSFTFNLGINALRGSTLLRRLNDGHYDEVPDQMLRWVHAGGRVVKGLVNRRQAEVKIWSESSSMS